MAVRPNDREIASQSGALRFARGVISSPSICSDRDVRSFGISVRCFRAGLSSLSLVTLAAFCVCMTASSFAQSESRSKRRKADPVREKFLKINYAFNRQLYHVAIPEYEEFVVQHPEFRDLGLVHYALGLSHYHVATKPPSVTQDGEEFSPRKHLEASVASLRRALSSKRFKVKAEATRVLGQALLRLQDYRGAEKAFEWVVRSGAKQKHVAIATLGLAECRYHLKEFHDAVDRYKEFLTSKPQGDEYDRATFYLGMSLYHLAQKGEEGAADALKIFRHVAQSSGHHAEDARYMVALMLAEQGDEAGASKLFESLADSENSVFRELGSFGLGSALFRAGKFEQAEQVLAKTIGSKGNGEHQHQALLLLARARIELGKGDAAEDLLGELVDSESVGDHASLVLSRLLKSNGKIEAATAVVEAAVQKFPRSALRADLELQFGLNAVAAEDYSGAASSFRSFLQDFGSTSKADHALYLLAFCLHRAGDYTAAGEACSQFLARYGESAYLPDVQQLAGENRFAAGDLAGAIQAYEGFVSSATASVDAAAIARARVRVGQALHLQEKYQEATDYLTSVEVPVNSADPQLLSVAYYRGDAAYQLGQYDVAIERLSAFLEAVENAPESVRSELLAQKRDAHFKIAHSHQLAQNWSAARSVYLEILKTDPDHPYSDQVLLEIGQTAHEEGKKSLAEKGFRRLIKNHPKSKFLPRALFFVGVYRSEQEEHERAVKYFRRIVDRYPDSAVAADAQYRLALSLRASGRGDEAQEVLAQFRERNPDDSRLSLVLLEEASQLSKTGQHEEALAMLWKLKEAPNSPSEMSRILYEIAWCYRGMDRPERAVETYQELADQLAILEASADDKRHAEFSFVVQLELAEMQFEQKNYENARALLLKLMETPRFESSQHQEGALYRLCWAHYKLQEHEELLATFKRFHARYAKSDHFPELAYLAAKTLLDQDKVTSAGKLFQRISESFPESREAPLAMLGHGESELEDRHFDVALKVFTAFRERYPDHDATYRAHFGEGWAHENLGALDKAIDAYSLAAAGNSTPTAARAQFQVGQCLVARKQFRKAILEFLKVEASFAYEEWTSKAVLQVAGCFEELKDPENAGKYYRNVVKSYPKSDEAKLARERLRRLEID